MLWLKRRFLDRLSLSETATHFIMNFFIIILFLIRIQRLYLLAYKVIFLIGMVKILGLE